MATSSNSKSETHLLAPGDTGASFAGAINRWCRERNETMPKRNCEVCDQAPADYWVKLEDLHGELLATEAVCRGCLPIVAPAMVPSADFADSNEQKPKKTAS